MPIRSQPFAPSKSRLPPVAPSGSALRPPSAVLRRRGAQPGNRNAFKHGFYAGRSADPGLRRLSAAPSISLPPAGAADHASILSSLNQSLEHEHGRAAEVAASLERSRSNSEFLAWNRLLTRRLADANRLTILIHKLEQAHALLPSLACDTHRLIAREFRGRNIPEHTVFVPLSFVTMDANLQSMARGGPILTDSQWFLIHETLASLRDDLDYFRKYRRRKPLPSARLLMEGVLLKLAFGVRWPDVPALIARLHPDSAALPLRACQRLHRDLYNSGRLLGILKALHSHLHVYGEARLDDLVEQGCFAVQRNRVALAPGGKLTWETFTALLLLQPALHSQRMQERERALDRRRQGLTWRLPPLPPLPRLPRTQRSLASPPRVDEHSVVYEPLESSLAWKKWQKQERINALLRHAPLSKSPIWGPRASRSGAEGGVGICPVAQRREGGVDRRAPRGSATPATSPHVHDPDAAPESDD